VGVHPSRKYESDGGPGVTDIIALLRENVRPAAAAQHAVDAFIDAVPTNWIIGAPMHMRRTSRFCLAGIRSGWRRFTPGSYLPLRAATPCA